jgi:hypothetical protein
MSDEFFEAYVHGESVEVYASTPVAEVTREELLNHIALTDDSPVSDDAKVSAIDYIRNVSEDELSKIKSGLDLIAQLFSLPPVAENE